LYISVVSGLSNPGGLIFVDTSKHDDTRDRGSDDPDCRDRDRESH
jgi:hypothetical protein